MEHAQFYALSDVMTIWDILSRWKKIPLEEMEIHINRYKGRRPALQPYELWKPSGEPNQHGIYLRPRTGRLFITEDIVASTCTVIDDDGNVITRDYNCQETFFGETLFFLTKDVALLEQRNPDYLAEPLKPPLHIEAQDEPEEQSPLKRSRRIVPIPDGTLRAWDAAAFLGISESTLWELAKNGEIQKGIKLRPKVTVWEIAALREYLENKKAISAANRKK